MTETDLAYLAGLLDGEGTIGYRPQADGRVNIELGVCMTEPAPIYWAHQATGRGNVYRRTTRERRTDRRDAWFWKVCRVSDIAEILTAVRPYMRVKHHEATAMLVVAHLRALKPHPTARSPYKEGEDMAGAIISRMKRRGWEEVVPDMALDMVVYLRKALAQRGEM